MTLENIDLTERKRMTKSYPVVIASFPGAGKSAAVEMLSPEDKMRTIILDLEAKGLPEDHESLYYRVIRLKSIDSPPMKDEGNVKYMDIEKITPYFKKIMASDLVDRVVIDTFTALVAELERNYVVVSSGFTVWNNYNQQLHDFFRTLKEETYTHGKFVYLLGHYKPSKDKKDPDAEKFMVVKGNAHFRLCESHFNTVLTIEDFKFVADNSATYDSTRIKRSLSPYESNENSLAELEETLTK